MRRLWQALFGSRNPASGSVETPVVTWAQPGSITPATPCPNCGATGEKTRLLSVSFRTPDRPMPRQARLLRCPDCTACFYDDQTVEDYGDDAMLGRGRVAFYVQQGAGLSLITRPLARLRLPPGSRYLEVGCGYGFGLDYARAAKAWQVRGLDPARLSEIGMAALDVPIEPRYLTDQDAAAASADVVMGAEVIEHVPSPAAFIATLKRALAPGGVLVLTTPDAAAVRPDEPPGALVPMLSPGLHLVLQSRASLEALLRAAGFTDVRIEVDGHSLVAFASDAALNLEDDPARLRAEYRAWLLARAAAMPPDGDAFLGLAGRALLECANDADIAGADAAWALLLPACQARFGLDIARLATLPPGLDRLELEQLATRMPLALGPILYASAMRDLAAGVERGQLGQCFAIAGQAADILRGALNRLAMEDGLAEEIGFACRMEQLINDALAGRADVAPRLAALSATADERRRNAGRRVFVAAVNGGHYKLGVTLARQEGLDAEAWSQQPDLAHVKLDVTARDALFCLAVLDAAHLREPARARRRFRRVQRDIAPTAPPPPDALFWAAVHGEMAAADQSGNPEGAFAAIQDAYLAAGRDPALMPAAMGSVWAQRAVDQFIRLASGGRLREARALEALAALRDTPPAGLSEEEQRQLRFALAVLDSQPGGDAARGREGFATLRAALPPDHALFWPCLSGELAGIAAAEGRAAAAILARETVSRSGVAEDDLPADLLAWLDPPP